MNFKRSGLDSRVFGLDIFCVSFCSYPIVQYLSTPFSRLVEYILGFIFERKNVLCSLGDTCTNDPKYPRICESGLNL